LKVFQPSANHIGALSELGFNNVGRWIPWTVKSGIKFELNSLRTKRVVYGFVVNGTAKYIGVCEKGTTCLEDRMNRYKSLKGSGQNKRIAEGIVATLNEGHAVEIWAIVPKPPVGYRGVVVDLVKGLENPLIEKFAPEWNR
jgi:hypothetical protein